MNVKNNKPSKQNGRGVMQNKNDEALRGIFCKLLDRSETRINITYCVTCVRKSDCDQAIQQINALFNKKSEAALDEAYLSDIIYCATQYLPLPDKDVAILNDKLLKAIRDAGFIHKSEVELEYAESELNVLHDHLIRAAKKIESLQIKAHAQEKGREMDTIAQAKEKIEK